LIWSSRENNYTIVQRHQARLAKAEIEGSVPAASRRSVIDAYN
jgi:hypothetical protein